MRKRGGGAPAPPFPPPTVSRQVLLDGGSDRDFRRMVDDLVRFSTRIQTLREAIAERMGISTPQYNILRTIAERGADADDGGVSDIARRLGVSVPFAVTQTGRLIEAGLVDKRPDPGDRRRVRLSLSKAGRAAITDAAPFQQRVNDILFACLTAKGFRDLKRTAEALNACAEEALGAIHRDR